MPGTRSNPLTLCCRRHTSGFGEAAAAPYPTVERPLLVTHVCTHTHSCMHTVFSFSPSFLIQGQIFPDAHYFSPPTNPAGRRLDCLFQRQPFCCFPPSFPSWEQRRVCIGACVHGDTGCGRILYAGSACSADTWTGVFFNSREQRRSRDMECLRLHKHRVRLYSVSFCASSL